MALNQLSYPQLEVWTYLGSYSSSFQVVFRKYLKNLFIILHKLITFLFVELKQFHGAVFPLFMVFMIKSLIPQLHFLLSENWPDMLYTKIIKSHNILKCKCLPSLYWHLGILMAKFDLSLATLPCISVQWLRSHQVYIFDQKERLAGRIVSNWAVGEVLFLCLREMHVLPLLVASAASLEPGLERFCVLTYGTVVQVFGAVAQNSVSIVVTVLPLFPLRVSLCICLRVCM